MALFLVRGHVTKTEYMGKGATSDTIMIVEARDEEQAGLAFQTHFETMSRSYATSYQVTDWMVTPSLDADKILKGET